MLKRSFKWKTKRKLAKLRRKWRDLYTVDSMVDICVDCFLVVFEVIYSPVLIVVRLVRHFFLEFIIDGVKYYIKKFIYWNRSLPPKKQKRNFWIGMFIIFGMPMILIILLVILLIGLLFY